MLLERGNRAKSQNVPFSVLAKTHAYLEGEERLNRILRINLTIVAEKRKRCSESKTTQSCDRFFPLCKSLQTQRQV